MKKIKFQLNGMNFQVESRLLRQDSGSSCIDTHPKTVASIVKQYVSKKHPEIMVWVSSESRGGSSVRVNLSMPNGESVPKNIYNDVESFANGFSAGSFNGMIDLYERWEGEKKTDNGTRINCYTKYIFVDNSPKWGSPQHTANMIQDLISGKYLCGEMTKETAVKKCVQEYGIKSKLVEKALEILETT
jgi:hypothetical protein